MIYVGCGDGVTGVGRRRMGCISKPICTWRVLNPDILVQLVPIIDP